MSAEPLPEREDEITVLVIDDDPDWVSLMGDLLEEEDDQFSIRTAEGAEEGLEQFRETPSVDCIVSDYKMPGMDGVELLSAVRTIRADIPFILVTAQGDEDVASEAIRSGVSDYVVKTRTTRRPAALATRIRKAVENNRLRRQVTESEERYRTLVEQSTDAIIISRAGELSFVNSRTAEILGYDTETLQGMAWRDLLHENDHDAAAVLWDADTDIEAATTHTFEARLLRADGETRIGAFSVSGISYEGQRATLCNVRDVTDEQARKRQLRKERNIKDALRDTLMHSTTQDDLEASICRELVSAEGYEFAWVGDIDGGRIDPRTWSGADGSYFDAVPLTVDGSEEPSLRAGEKQEAVYIDDIAAMPEAPWREAALDRGFEAVAAVPMLYDGISYGVLCVYTDEAGVFDDRERELLTDMAEGLGYAINSLQRQTAVTSDSIVELDLRIEAPGYPLSDLTAGPLSGGSITVRDAVERSDAVVMFLVTDGIAASEVAEALEGHDAVHSVDHVEGTTGQLRVAEDPPTVGTTLRKHGSSVRQLTFADGVATARLAFPVNRDITAAIDVLRDEYRDVAVQSVREQDRTVTSPQDRLQDSLGGVTDKQIQAMRMAYHSGYFDQPRGSSADEVADGIGVSRSTFLQHLRAGQRKVFRSLFDDGA